MNVSRGLGANLTIENKTIHSYSYHVTPSDTPSSGRPRVTQDPDGLSDGLASGGRIYYKFLFPVNRLGTSSATPQVCCSAYCTTIGKRNSRYPTHFLDRSDSSEPLETC